MLNPNNTYCCGLFDILALCSNFLEYLLVVWQQIQAKKQHITSCKMANCCFYT